MQQDDIPQVPSVNQGVMHLMMTTGVGTNLPFGTSAAVTFNNTGMYNGTANVSGTSYSVLGRFPPVGKTRVFICSTMVGTVVDAKSYIIPYDTTWTPGNTITQVSVQNIVNSAATACVSYAVYDITLNVPQALLYFKFNTGATTYTSADFYIWYSPTGFLLEEEKKKSIEQRLKELELKYNEKRDELDENEKFRVPATASILRQPAYGALLNGIETRRNIPDPLYIPPVYEEKKSIPPVEEEEKPSYLHYHLSKDKNNEPIIINHDHDPLLCSEDFCDDSVCPEKVGRKVPGAIIVPGHLVRGPHVSEEKKT